jgi:hypothetical protein
MQRASPRGANQSSSSPTSAPAIAEIHQTEPTPHRSESTPRARL